MSAQPVALAALGVGLFTIIAALTDWGWFFGHRKAKFFVDAFGRNGARVFYGVLGCAIILLGLYCR